MLVVAHKFQATCWTGYIVPTQKETYSSLCCNFKTMAEGLQRVSNMSIMHSLLINHTSVSSGKQRYSLLNDSIRPDLQMRKWCNLINQENSRLLSRQRWTYLTIKAILLLDWNSITEDRKIFLGTAVFNSVCLSTVSDHEIASSTAAIVGGCFRNLLRKITMKFFGRTTMVYENSENCSVHCLLKLVSQLVTKVVS